MNISEFSVRRYQLTLVVFGMLIALGVTSLLSIPKAEDPTFPIPIFNVIAVYPGASPSDVERLVADPIERELQSLDDIKTIRTTIEDGLAVLLVEFTAGTDPDARYDDVLREINALRPTMPPELLNVEVRRANAANVSIAEFALISPTASYRELEDHAYALRRRFEALPAVKDVHTLGYPSQEVRVSLDLDRLAALGITANEVIGALRADAQSIPAGSVDAGSRRMTVRTSGDFASVDEVNNVVVRSAEGRAVHVRDLAEVTMTDAEVTSFARFNGQRAVIVAVAQKEHQNIFAVQGELDRVVREYQHELPASIRLQQGFNQSHNVEHRLSGFSRDFMLAIALVLITLLPLGVRASAVVMISIPLSLSVGLFLLQSLGYSINQLSIVGFVLALGLLVDDSVVVVENISRFLRMGKGPKEAAIEATRQITVSVLGCTATLLFAFVPLLALPGTAGQFIRSMPLAAVLTIAASLLVSLTIVPFLSALLLKPEKDEHGNIVLRLLMRGIEASYRPVLDRALRHPRVTMLLALLLVVGSAALVPAVGFSLFPKAGTPQFMVLVQTPEGSSLPATDRAALFVEQVLARHPEVRNVATMIGEGHPQIYYNITPGNEKPNVAEVFAELSPDGLRRSASIYERIRSELASYAGATLELKEFENGPPLTAPIEMRLLGHDTHALELAAAEVERVLLATSGTRDVRNNARDRKTDLRVVTDRDRAGLYGVSVPDIDVAVRLGLAGIVAAEYRENGRGDEAYDVRVVLNHEGRPAIDSLDHIHVPSNSGAQIPLRQLARVEMEQSPTALHHHNRERATTVTAQVETGYNTDRVTRAALQSLERVQLPDGVRLVPAGELESRSESFGGLGTAIVVAAFGVLAILVLEFRTFKSTLIVASVIPLGIVGGIFALFLSGNTLSFTAVVGFIALIGIEVKNSILLVDFTNHLREEGVGLEDAIRRAGETRFLPILLTTLTALGGLLPLALEGSPLYSPLAIVIMGGLISSTLLARIVTPVLYKMLAPEILPRPLPAGAPSSPMHTDPNASPAE